MGTVLGIMNRESLPAIFPEAGFPGKLASSSPQGIRANIKRRAMGLFQDPSRAPRDAKTLSRILIPAAGLSFSSRSPNFYQKGVGLGWGRPKGLPVCRLSIPVEGISPDLEGNLYRESRGRSNQIRARKNYGVIHPSTTSWERRFWLSQA
jgi:hypothetical protein